MAEKSMVVTTEGYKKLKDELDYLKGEKRIEVRENLAVARSFGDLSENSEYDEARNEQTKVETRINELEELLKNITVIDESELERGKVNLGMTVKVYDEDMDEEVVYQMVGTNEVDPDANKISNVSPIGKALLGKKKGQIAEVEAPGGKFKLKILEVKKTQ